jgi:hypothetical protein
MAVVRVDKGRAAMGDAALRRDRFVICSGWSSEWFQVEWFQVE